MHRDRRAFIKNALYGVLALIGLGFILPALKTLSPSRRQAQHIVFFPLLFEDDVPRAGVRKAELVYTASGKERRTRVFVVSSSTGISVYSAVCSHLGCLVNYYREKKEFVCPCHGGRYDLTGKNIAGPPPAPLTRLPVKIEAGTIYVGMRVQKD